MNYLILGATGTLGKATIRELLKSPETGVITCVSRDELKQAEMKKEFPDERLEFGLGDIRDKESIEPYFENVETLFHSAALKRIPEMEANPVECLKTNAIGAMNAAELAHKAGVKHFVFSSTDKACMPVNTYGACKFIAEQYILNLGKRSETNFSVYRWGNVIGSRGSVVHEFKRTLQTESKVYITDPKMTRFWIRIEDAVCFMLRTFQEHSESIKVPPMKSAPVFQLAECVAKELGINLSDVVWKTTGLRPGEKIHEAISYEGLTGYVYDSYEALEFLDSELRELVRAVL
jgi:UDP-N-acetylglucosamine 4,6-dehydratase